MELLRLECLMMPSFALDRSFRLTAMFQSGRSSEMMNGSSPSGAGRASGTGNLRIRTPGARVASLMSLLRMVRHRLRGFLPVARLLHLPHPLVKGWVGLLMDGGEHPLILRSHDLLVWEERTLPHLLADAALFADALPSLHQGLHRPVPSSSFV
jgi:hypothetical protein